MSNVWTDMNTIAISLSIAVAGSIQASLGVWMQPRIASHRSKEDHYILLAKRAWFDRKNGAKGRAKIQENKADRERTRRICQQILLFGIPLVSGYCTFLVLTK